MNTTTGILLIGGAAALVYFATRDKTPATPSKEQCDDAVGALPDADKVRLLTVVNKMVKKNEPTNNAKNAAALQAYADSIRPTSPLAARCIEQRAIPTVLAGNYA